MLHFLFLVSLAVIALLAIVAVLHNSFNDNLLQRIGLTGVFFGASVNLLHVMLGMERQSPGYLFTCGFAVYGIGTAWKCWKYRNSKGST